MGKICEMVEREGRQPLTCFRTGPMHVRNITGSGWAGIRVGTAHREKETEEGGASPHRRRKRRNIRKKKESRRGKFREHMTVLIN